MTFGIVITPAKCGYVHRDAKSPTCEEGQKMIVHPAYSVIDRVWFLEEQPNVTAITLRALQDKLPLGTTIKDYYPNGFSAKQAQALFPKEKKNAVNTPPHVIQRKFNGAFEFAKQPSPQAAKAAPTSATTPAGTPPRPVKRRYDRDLILNLWAADVAPDDIMGRCGLPTFNSLNGAIQKAKLANDPRAFARRTRHRRWDKTRDRCLLLLIEGNHPLERIAKRLGGVTANEVLQRLRVLQADEATQARLDASSHVNQGHDARAQG